MSVMTAVDGASGDLEVDYNHSSMSASPELEPVEYVACQDISDTAPCTPESAPGEEKGEAEEEDDELIDVEEIPSDAAISLNQATDADSGHWHVGFKVPSNRTRSLRWPVYKNFVRTPTFNILQSPVINNTLQLTATNNFLPLSPFNGEQSPSNLQEASMLTDQRPSFSSNKSPGNDSPSTPFKSSVRWPPSNNLVQKSPSTDLILWPSFSESVQLPSFKNPLLPVTPVVQEEREERELRSAVEKSSSVNDQRDNGNLSTSHITEAPSENNVSTVVLDPVCLSETDEESEVGASAGEIEYDVPGSETEDSLPLKVFKDTVSPFTCQQCEQTFTSRAGLVSHLRVHVQKEFACKDCDQSFNTLPGLSAHIQIHKDDESPKIAALCNICDRVYSDTYILELHMKIHKDVKSGVTSRDSQKCESTLTNVEGLTNHSRVYKCHTCERVFTHRGGLSLHKRSRFKCFKESMKCNKCDKPFKIKSRLELHVQSCEGLSMPFECKLCNRLFSSPLALATHTRQSHRASRVHVCKNCGTTFKLNSNFVAHMRICKGVSPFPCKLCDRSFWLPSALAHHMQVGAHESFKSVVKSFTCKKCGTFFKIISRSKLMLHMQVCKGSEMFPCNLCDRTFPQASDLASHIQGGAHKDVKTGTKSFVCKKCDQSFTIKSDLNLHFCNRSDAHGSSKSFACNHCERSFRFPSGLSLHNMRVHKGDQALEESPSSNINLTEIGDDVEMMPPEPHFDLQGDSPNKSDDIHMEPTKSGLDLQGESLSKSVACKHCDRTFRFTAGLALHMQVHKGDKDLKESPSSSINLTEIVDDIEMEPTKSGFDLQGESLSKSVACKHCDRTFRFAAGLALHMRVHKDVKGRKESPMSNINLTEIVDDVEMEPTKSGFDLQCDSPNKSDDVQMEPTKSGLDLQSESPNKSVACTHCDRTFRFAAGLALHMRVHKDVKGRKESPMSNINLTEIVDDVEMEPTKSGFDLQCDSPNKSDDVQMEPTKSGLDLQSESPNKSVACTHCDRTFRFAAGLALHMRVHKDVKGLKESPLSNIDLTEIVDDVEIKPTKSGLDLQSDSPNKSDDVQMEPTKPGLDHQSESLSKSVACTHCDRTFRFAAGLALHMRVHKDVKGLKESPLSNIDLTEIVDDVEMEPTDPDFDHQDSEASVEDPFDFEDMLDAHLVTRAGSEAAMLISSVLKSSDVLSEERNNVRQRKRRYKPKRRRVSSIRVGGAPIYRCDTCGKRNNQKAALKYHIMAHHWVNDVETFGCEVPQCRERFFNPSGLSRHKLLHKPTGTKPKVFKCIQCSKTFKHKASRLIHERKHSTRRSQRMMSIPTRIHTRNDTTKRFECGICKKDFTRNVALEAHVIAVHSNPKFECDLCNKKYKGLSSLEQHMLSRHSIESPSKTLSSNQTIHDAKCSTDQDSNDSIIESQGNKNPKLECSICGKTYKQLVKLNQHIVLCHNSTQNQSKCQKIQNTMHSMGKVNRHFTLKLHDINLTAKCVDNGLVSTEINRAINTITASSDTQLMTVEPRLVTAAYNDSGNECLANDASDNKLNSSCIDDCEDLRTLADLQREKPHNDMHLSAETTTNLPIATRGKSMTKKATNTYKIKPYICFICKKGFAFGNIESHMLNHHDSDPKPFACKVCDKRFKENSLLLFHMVKHSNYAARTLVCDYCKRRFVSKSDLRAHLRSCKRCVEVFKCHICRCRFDRRAYLKRHLSTLANDPEHVLPCESPSGKSDHKFLPEKSTEKHHVPPLLSTPKQRNRVEEYACDFLMCSKRFYGKDGKHCFISHLSTHSKDVKAFACSVCNEELRSVKELNDHLQNHPREFECHICDKLFISHANLTLHLLKHEGKKKHACWICKRGFKLKAECDAHELQHQDKPFKYGCNVCGRKFKVKSLLTKHESVHSVESLKPFACQILNCGKRFVRGFELRHHVRKSHVGDNIDVSPTETNQLGKNNTQCTTSADSVCSGNIDKEMNSKQCEPVSTASDQNSHMRFDFNQPNTLGMNFVHGTPTSTESVKSCNNLIDINESNQQEINSNYCSPSTDSIKKANKFIGLNETNQKEMNSNVSTTSTDSVKSCNIMAASTETNLKETNFKTSEPGSTALDQGSNIDFEFNENDLQDINVMYSTPTCSESVESSSIIFDFNKSNQQDIHSRQPYYSDDSVSVFIDPNKIKQLEITKGNICISSNEINHKEINSNHCTPCPTDSDKSGSTIICSDETNSVEVTSNHYTPCPTDSDKSGKILICSDETNMLEVTSNHYTPCPIDSDKSGSTIICSDETSTVEVTSNHYTPCPIDSDKSGKILICSDETSAVEVTSNHYTPCPIDSDISSSTIICSDEIRAVEVTSNHYTPCPIDSDKSLICSDETSAVEVNSNTCKPSSTDLEKTVTYNLCKKRFTLKHLFEPHLSKQDNFPPSVPVHLCTVCGQSLESKSSLRAHMLQTHMQLHSSFAEAIPVEGESCSSKTVTSSEVQQLHSSVVEAIPGEGKSCSAITVTSSEVQQLHSSVAEAIPVKGKSCRAKTVTSSEVQQLNSSVAEAIPVKGKSPNAETVSSSEAQHILSAVASTVPRVLCFKCANAKRGTSSDSAFVPVEGEDNVSTSHITEAPSENNVSTFVVDPVCSSETDEESEVGASAGEMEYDVPGSKTEDGLPLEVLKDTVWPFTCEQCEQTFMSKMGVTSPLHVHNKQFACKDCDESFNTLPGLSAHIMVHKFDATSSTAVSCSQCEQIFGSNAGLVSHMRIHKMKIQKEFACKDCDESFNTLPGLSAHITVHKFDATSPTAVTCSQCEQICASKAGLVSHMRIHQMKIQKEFACKDCDQSFNTLLGFLTHIQIHKDDESPKTVTSGEVQCNPVQLTSQTHENVQGPSRSGPKNFVCYVCAKWFPLRASLNTHLLIHSSSKPYICEVCESAFSEPTELRVHLPTHCSFDKQLERCDVCDQRLLQAITHRRRAQYFFGV